MSRTERSVTAGAVVALIAAPLFAGPAVADPTVEPTADPAVAGAQHNVTYRARIDGLARGAVITYRISDAQIKSADPTMLPGRTFETNAVLTDPKQAGMRISIEWPYSANLHCEILVDDQLVTQADQIINPRITPSKNDPDYGAMNCGAPLSNAVGVPITAATPGAGSPGTGNAVDSAAVN